MIRYCLLILVCLGLIACKAKHTPTTSTTPAKPATTQTQPKAKNSPVVETNSGSQKYDDPAYY